jgi:hypothetical protein
VIHSTVVDADVTPMLAWIDKQLIIDPKGRVNPYTGKSRIWGAIHTIPLDQLEFNPLIDKINSIASSQLENYCISDIWSNFNPPGTIPSQKHNHNGASIAGCFYVSVPKDSGKIVFETGEEFYPSAGDLLWWDANLIHWVTENSSLENRYSIAFNITQKFN